MMLTTVKRGSKVKAMSPGTVRLYHGLLLLILKEAVAEPPLRDRNPCDLTRLPVTTTGASTTTSRRTPWSS